jgi:ribulose-phosphate 3-epimerase
MITVVPAIIPHTKEQLEEEIKKVAGFAPLVQIDISDGIFVPTKTWPYNGRDEEFFRSLKSEEVGLPMWEDVNFEVHLMVKNPEDVVRDWIYTGAGTIVAHIEATENFQKVIDICRENIVSVGIAIKPSTDISKIDEFVPEVDFIQCMGSDLLGKHGVELEEKAIEQIKTLRRKYPDSIIGIDIGVTEDSAENLVLAGATKLIVGSAILDSDDPEEVYKYLSKIN